MERITIDDRDILRTRPISTSYGLLGASLFYPPVTLKTDNPSHNMDIYNLYIEPLIEGRLLLIHRYYATNTRT